MLFDIEWYGEGQYCNQFPELIMFSDEEMPGEDVHRYVAHQTEHGTLYFSDNHPFLVNFCLSTSNKNGYGGRTFHLNMVDGSTVDVKGPWSSGSYFTNSLGLTPCIEGYYVGPNGTKYHGDFKVSFVQSLIDEGVIDATIMHYVPTYGGDCYQLIPNNMTYHMINGLDRIVKEIV